MTIIREELLKKYGQYHKIENMEDGCIADEFVYEIRQIIIKKLDEKITNILAKESKEITFLKASECIAQRIILAELKGELEK